MGIVKPDQTVVAVQGWKGGLGHTNTLRVLSWVPRSCGACDSPADRGSVHAAASRATRRTSSSTPSAASRQGSCRTLASRPLGAPFRAPATRSTKRLRSKFDRQERVLSYFLFPQAIDVMYGFRAAWRCPTRRGLEWPSDWLLSQGTLVSLTRSMVLNTTTALPFLTPPVCPCNLSTTTLRLSSHASS